MVNTELFRLDIFIKRFASNSDHFCQLFNYANRMCFVTALKRSSRESNDYHLLQFNEPLFLIHTQQTTNFSLEKLLKMFEITLFSTQNRHYILLLLLLLLLFLLFSYSALSPFSHQPKPMQINKSTANLLFVFSTSTKAK